MSKHVMDAEDVFLAALDKATPDERLAFVEEVCTHHLELYERVRELLAAHDEAQGPLDVAPPGLPSIHNHLAWLLATCPDESIHDPQRAVTLAERAVALDGVRNNINTLRLVLFGHGPLAKGQSRRGPHLITRPFSGWTSTYPKTQSCVDSATKRRTCCVRKRKRTDP